MEVQLRYCSEKMQKIVEKNFTFYLFLNCRKICVTLVFFIKTRGLFFPKNLRKIKTRPVLACKKIKKKPETKKSGALLVFSVLPFLICLKTVFFDYLIDH